jgi:integrase
VPRQATRVLATERDVRRAASDGRRVEYRTRVQNLVLRVSPAGKAWQFRFRLSRERKWRAVSLGQWPMVDYERARADALKLSIAVRDGKDPRTVLQRSARGVMTFRTVASIYIADHESQRLRRGRNCAWTRECSRILDGNILPVIGDSPAEAVTRADVAAAVEKVTRRGSYRLADLTLGIIRTIYNWATDTGLLDGADPTRRLRKRHSSAARERTLSDEELRRLRWRLDEPGPLSAGIRCALWLELLGGVRVGEAVGAAKSEFDLAKRIWTIPGVRTKNGREHRLPLSDWAVQIIGDAMQRSGESPWLFPSPRGDGPIRPKSASRAVLRVQRQWEREDHRDAEPARPNPSFFRGHDLRRTLATRLGDMGVSDDVIGRVLNHRPQTVTGRHYDHARRFEEMRDAIDRWSVQLQRIVNGPARGGPAHAPADALLHPAPPSGA